MLKKLSTIFAAMILVTSLSVSFTASAEKLASSETGKAVVFSCDDGVYTGIDESRYINIVDGSVEGDKVHTPGGRSLKWFAGTLYLRLTGKGVTQIPNKKKLCIRVYNPGTDTLRTNIKIYDGNGNELKVHSSYPIYSYKSREDAHGWDTIELDISGVTNWPDNADTAISVSLSATGGTVYVDSAWIEYAPAGLTQKHDADSKLLYNMGSQEYKDLVSSDSEYARVLGGSGSFDTAGAEDSKYAYKWIVSSGAALKVSRYAKLTDINLKDYAANGYNLVFRMKSAIPEGDSLPLNLWLSPVYRGAAEAVNSTNYPASKTFYVTPDAWHDYAVPLSSLSAAIAGDGTMNTVLWQAGGKTVSGSVLYIDRIFLAKQQSTETLSVPDTTLADSDVNRYLQGGNKVNFTFSENLKTTGVDYVSAVTVQKNGETTRDGIAVSVSGNTLSVISADALDSSAEYTITLNKDYIVSADGKKMESNYTKTFTTAAEACMIKNVNATQSGAAGVISNNTTRGRSYVVVLSAYKGNSLKTVKLVPEWVPPMSEENIDAAFDTDVSECDTFKAFVWNSLDSMVPFENR